MKFVKFCILLMSFMAGGALAATPTIGNYTNANTFTGTERFLMGQGCPSLNPCASAITVEATPPQIAAWLQLSGNFFPAFVSGGCLSNNGTALLWTDCGTPGGSDFELQYNNSGSLGGIALGTTGYPLLSDGSSGAPAFGQLSLASAVTGVLPVANGGNGTSTPALIAGANITLAGSWPNYTISSSGGGGGNVSNTGTPAAGQLAEWTSATVIGGQTLGGDCTLSTATITCTKTNGTAFGTLATANAATPPAIGGTTPAAGAFTTLSASSTVSGSGFSTYLASPPAIGGTTPAAAHFTTIGATGQITSTLSTGTAPLSVASTTEVANLNAASVDGYTLPCTVPTLVSGEYLTNNGSTCSWAAVSGSGTVTSFSFTDGGGINGTVATATTTPALSLTPSFSGITYATSGTGFGAATAANILSVVNSQTCDSQTGTTYTFALGDANNCVMMSNASANTITVPPNASVAFPVGTTLTVVQTGAGTTTLDGAGSPVTLESAKYGSSTSQTYAFASEYSCISLQKIATDTWFVSSCDYNPGSSGLSGMTAGQVPIAATASTVTSSKPLAGSGTAITTGPTASTSGDVVTYIGTAGQTQDSGTALTTLLTSGGALGTPSSGTLTNATGLPISTGVSGLGTGVATALGNAISSAGAVTETIASGTLALPTDALSGNTCSASATTATATGAAATDTVIVTYASDPTGVTGYGAGTSGGITVRPWLTANTLNVKLCDETSGSITPGALSINWRVVR